jgi:signal transduction histidine kinase
MGRINLDKPMPGLPIRTRFLGWIRGNSFHAKLLATYLLLTVLGTSLMAGYLLRSFYIYFINTRQTELENWSAALGESIAEALVEDDYERANLIVGRYGEPETLTLRVFNPQGQLMATSDPRDYQVRNWLTVVGIQEGLQNQVAQGVAKGVLSDDDRLYIVRPIQENGQLLGILRMSITLEQFQRQFARLVWTVLGAMLLTIILCAVISDRLAYSLSQPIKTMRDFATRLGGGHFGDKLRIRQSNELDELALELNRMSERLASLDQERRAFLANVSHELRTPISNIQVTVEALKSGAVEEPKLRQRFFQTIEDETQRLARLIHDLLDLGRLEAGVTQLEQQPILLSNLIERAVRAVESRMQAKGMKIRLQRLDVSLQGDPERLLQAFLNILDNAIKHSSSNSSVWITGHREGEQVVIHIQDEGVGISETDLPHVFEQFYTADPSRKGSSTGLGLAIAQRIVQAHGGVITASSRIGKGARFTICLPLSGQMGAIKSV